MIRPATSSDAPHIAQIYNHYINTSIITFEETPVSAAEIADRIQAVLDDDLPWIVAEDHETLVGYAYATRWRARAAYRNSVEVTVYLDKDRTGAGCGTKLYRALFDLLAKKEVHTVIGGIALPNDASIALHEKLGMKKVAHFEQVGHKFGKWIDVAYWQKHFFEETK